MERGYLVAALNRRNEAQPHKDRLIKAFVRAFGIRSIQGQGFFRAEGLMNKAISDMICCK